MSKQTADDVDDDDDDDDPPAHAEECLQGMQQSSVGLLGTSGRIATTFLLCLAIKVGTIKRATVSVRLSTPLAQLARFTATVTYLFYLKTL